MKLYVPEQITNSKCVVVNSNYIRVYQSKPQSNRSINYTDYYFNNHYLELYGTQNFGNNITVTCSTAYDYTTDFYYRNDISDILLTFMLISIVIFGIPIYLFKKLFRGCI